MSVPALVDAVEAAARALERCASYANRHSAFFGDPSAVSFAEVAFELRESFLRDRRELGARLATYATAVPFSHGHQDQTAPAGQAEHVGPADPTATAGAAGSARPPADAGRSVT